MMRQAVPERAIRRRGDASGRVLRTRHVSDDTKQANAEVRLARDRRIRVILAHGYFRIDLDIVGGVVEHDILVLRSQLLSIAEALADPEDTPPS